MRLIMKAKLLSRKVSRMPRSSMIEVAISWKKFHIL